MTSIELSPTVETTSPAQPRAWVSPVFAQMALKDALSATSQNESTADATTFSS